MVAPPVSRPAAPVPRSEAAARPGPLVSATVAILVATTCIPLGYVAWGAVSVGWTRAYELVVRPRVGELLFNTVALVVVTVPLCVVIGVGGGLAGGADRPSRPALLASVIRCAAGRSGIRQQLCLGRRDPVSARAVGGCA